MIQANQNGLQTAVLRYDEYRASRLAEAERATADSSPAALAAAAAEAQRRYQESLRAFPPGYYERVARATRRHDNAAEGAVAPDRVAAATDELTDHNYDGIEEYDNPTPGWWYMVFAATIVFSALYLPVYHLIVPSLPERHAAAQERVLERRFAELNKYPMGEEKVLAIMAEPSWLEQGHNVFTKSCAVCHAADASGIIGPNLTDEYYRNVDSLMGIAGIIADGTPSKAMPPQKVTLNENEIALVTAYVASLRGQNLPTNPAVNPDYHGRVIAPWPLLTESGEGAGRQVTSSR